MDMIMTTPHYSRGDRVRVFDYRLWDENGGDCQCGCQNRCFRKPATIINIYLGYAGGSVVDVQFDHRGESRGHFVWAIEKL